MENQEKTLSQLMSEQVESASEQQALPQGSDSQPQEQSNDNNQTQIQPDTQPEQQSLNEQPAQTQQPVEQAMPTQADKYNSIVENLKATVSETQELANQQAQAAQQNISEQMSESARLDEDILLFGTEQERQAELNRYSNEIQKPFLEREKALEQKVNELYEINQREQTMKNLSKDRDYYDFAQKSEQILRFIDAHPEFKNLGRGAYEAAYLVIKGNEGLKEHNTPKPQQSTQDIVKNLKANPEVYAEVIKLIKEETTRDLLNKEVPPALAFSQGFANTGANLNKAPQTLDEAFKQSLEQVNKY